MPEETRCSSSSKFFKHFFTFKLLFFTESNTSFNWEYFSIRLICDSSAGQSSRGIITVKINRIKRSSSSSIVMMNQKVYEGTYVVNSKRGAKHHPLTGCSISQHHVKCKYWLYRNGNSRRRESYEAELFPWSIKAFSPMPRKYWYAVCVHSRFSQTHFYEEFLRNFHTAKSKSFNA